MARSKFNWTFNLHNSKGFRRSMEGVANRGPNQAEAQLEKRERARLTREAEIAQAHAEHEG